MIDAATYAPIAARRRAFFSSLRPDPLQTVAEYADECLQLPSFAPVPGPWRTSRTPFLKEIMECLSPRHRCKKVVFMKPVQIGGTQVAVNWVVYTMDRSPTAMLFYEPGIDMAKRLTKEKLDPVIRSMPTLRGKVKDARSRDSGNTTYRKEYLGGFLNILWANSSASARSTSAPRIVLDEVDEYEHDVGDQGHPCDLIAKRAAAYGRYKIFELSTPTLEETSRIARQYQLGSQGRYYVPCPLCGHYQHLVWERLIYTFDGVTRPDAAAYQCEGCQQLIDERHKTWMMDSARAKWVHAYPERLAETASFHLNLLYQPAGWAYPWSRLAEDYMEAYEKIKAGDSAPMKTFRNTVLAKTWEEKLDKVNQDGLCQRREVYEAIVPGGAVLLTAGVDVQDNRLEAEIVGWGLGDESWCIEYRIFHGSPSSPNVWMELTDWLQATYRHASGRDMRVESVGIDTGGHHTKEAYGFVERYRGICFALKGSSQDGAPPIPKRRPNRMRNRRVELYIIGTNALKDTVFARMKLTAPGPGYMHFPRRDGYDEEYFKGLASEVKKPKYKPRSSVQIGFYYDKIYTRNEPLDLKVYNLAAMMLLRPNLERLAEKMQQPVQVEIAAPEDVAVATAPWVPRPTPQPQPSSAPKRGAGWTNGWRS